MKKKQVYSLSPSAVTETVDRAAGRRTRRASRRTAGTSTVHSRRRAARRTSSSHVRWDVGSLTRTLGLGIGAKAEAAHVELIRHIVGYAFRVESLNIEHKSRRHEEMIDSVVKITL